MVKGFDKILVVDDEYLICEILNEFLSMQGYQVTTTTNGQDAISKFDEIKAREQKDFGSIFKPN